MRKDFLICILFFNEEKNLKKLIPILKNYKNNFLFINDGSNDNSVNLIKKTKYKLKSHKENYGYGAAVKSAIRYAYKNGYKYCGVLPGDNQRKINDLLKMYNQIKNNKYDIVAGSKLNANRIPFLRSFGNFLFSKLFSIFFNYKNKDVMSGFKIYRTEIVNQYLSILPNNYSFDVLLNYIIVKKKIKTHQISVFCNYKNQSSKITNIFITSLIIFYQLIEIIIKFKFSNDKKYK